jgi:hypothetical protein
MRSLLVLGVMVCGVGVMPVWGYGAEKRATIDTIAQDAQETVEATKQYTAQQKEAFQKAAHAELEAIQRQVRALQSKAGQASASARAEMQKSLFDLGVKKEATGKQLDELRLATDSRWDEVKSGIHRAIDEMKQSYRNILSRLP